MARELVQLFFSFDVREVPGDAAAAARTLGGPAGGAARVVSLEIRASVGFERPVVLLCATCWAAGATPALRRRHVDDAGTASERDPVDRFDAALDAVALRRFKRWTRIGLEDEDLVYFLSMFPFTEEAWDIQGQIIEGLIDDGSGEAAEGPDG